MPTSILSTSGVAPGGSSRPDGRARRAAGVTRAASAVLIAAGAASLLWYGATIARASWVQHRQAEELVAAWENRAAPAAEIRPAELPSDPSGASDSSRAAAASPAAIRRASAVVGQLEIPRVGVSAMVRHGDDNETLDVAIGHLPGTAWPGESGNVALAGHRDTLFRGLRHIRRGDDITITTPDGPVRYRVEDTFVVNPRDVWVLQRTGENVLTLITCYPFNYVGSAPRRFIVRAAQVGSPAPPRAASLGTHASSLPGDRFLNAAPVVPGPANQVRLARAAHDRPHALRSAAASPQRPEASSAKGSAFTRGLKKVFGPVARLFGKKPPRKN
jgi:sortase A